MRSAVMNSVPFSFCAGCGNSPTGAIPETTVKPGVDQAAVDAAASGDTITVEPATTPSHRPASGRGAHHCRPR
jgi:hypothetical protein